MANMQYNVMLTWWQITNGWLNANETRDAASVCGGHVSFAFNHQKYCELSKGSNIHKLRRGFYSCTEWSLWLCHCDVIHWDKQGCATVASPLTCGFLSLDHQSTREFHVLHSHASKTIGMPWGVCGGVCDNAGKIGSCCELRHGFPVWIIMNNNHIIINKISTLLYLRLHIKQGFTQQALRYITTRSQWWDW